MNRKICTLVLSTAIAVSTMTACGNSASSGEAAVSDVTEEDTSQNSSSIASAENSDDENESVSDVEDPDSAMDEEDLQTEEQEKVTLSVENTVESAKEYSKRIAVGDEEFLAVLESDGSVIVASFEDSDFLWEEDETISEWTDIVLIDGDDKELIALTSDGIPMSYGTSDDSVWTMALQNKYESDWAETWAEEGRGQIVDMYMDDGYLVFEFENGTYDVKGYSLIKASQTLLEEESDLVQIEFGEEKVAGLRSDGTVAGYKTKSQGEFEDYLTYTEDLSDVVQIEIGRGYIAALKSDGTVETPSAADYIDTSEWSDIVQIAGGDYTFWGLKSDGTVVVTGQYTSSVEENEDNWSGVVALKCDSTSYYIVGLCSDGSIIGRTSGRGEMTELLDAINEQLLADGEITGN